MDIKDRVLVVEDDKSIRNFFRTVLEANNYDVIMADTGTEAYSLITSRCPDVVILDLGLPDMDGMKILKNVREWSSMPIIVVSARTHERDKVEALDLGADDYITKPFSVAEVLARIRANIRRTTQYDISASDAPAILRAGEVTMNLSDYTVTKSGDRIELTVKEFEILKLLMQNPKKVYTKEQLYGLVWKDAYLGDENAVNVHISRLRNKIEEDSRNPRYILTVWGIGYKLGEMP